MFNSVLLPFDHRFIPRMALRAAAALAQSGAQITLLHVTDITSEFPEAFLTAIAAGDIERHNARVMQKIGDVSALLSEYGATAGATLIVRGKPVHAVINRIASEIRADAILMGTRGRRGLSRMLRGSVTEDVMREADVPVIVIRESSRKPFFPLFQEQELM